MKDLQCSQIPPFGRVKDCLVSPSKILWLTLVLLASIPTISLTAADHSKIQMDHGSVEATAANLRLVEDSLRDCEFAFDSLIDKVRCEEAQANIRKAIKQVLERIEERKANGSTASKETLD